MLNEFVSVYIGARSSSLVDHMWPLYIGARKLLWQSEETNLELNFGLDNGSRRR